MKYIKIILAVALLLCLEDMPYGYYTLIRFVSMVVFGYMAYQYLEEKNQKMMITFGALTLLFQPFMPLALGRQMWNLVDVAVALLLFVVVYKRDRKKK